MYYGQKSIIRNILCKYILHSIAFHFLSDVSFEEQKSLILIKSNLSNFSFMNHISGIIS